MENRQHGYLQHITDFETYRQLVIETEDQLLKHANILRPGEQYYSTRGDEIGSFAMPYIGSFVKTRSQQEVPTRTPIRVLEIGGGEGNAIHFLLSIFPNDNISYTMTSLNPLPVHDRLKKCGVDVITQVIAEKMPDEWENFFDVVMTSRLLGWTNLIYSIPEIKRVLAPGGTWCGFEGANCIMPGCSYSVLISDAVEQTMAQHQMINQISMEKIISCKRGLELYPFKWTK